MFTPPQRTGAAEGQKAVPGPVPMRGGLAAAAPVAGCGGAVPAPLPVASMVSEAVAGVAARPGAGAAKAASAQQAASAGPHTHTAPTDLCYGIRVGIRSLSEQRYVAAFMRGPAGNAGSSDGFDLEVAGYHPFRQGEVTDRAADCPSEWVLVHHSSRQHKGPVHFGDEVCFAKELATAGDRKRDRLAYLSLAPNTDGTAMEPVVERRDGSHQGADLCRWTLVSAESPDARGKIQVDSPLLIRGKYNECLGVGRSVWEAAVAAGGASTASGVPPTFRSPSRASGRQLACRGRDARARELQFRIVRAGVPFGPDPGGWVVSAVPAPVGLRDDPDTKLAGVSLEEQERLLLEDALFCLLGLDGVHIRKSLGSVVSGRDVLPETRFELLVPEGADASTVQFLRQILPLCEHHTAVQRFIELQGRYDCGTVNHALCAAMRELLKEFATKVGQLETALRSGGFSIAKLWYHIQPSMDTFALLHRVASHVYGLTGGLVLSGLEEVMSRSSLSAAQDLCEFLLQHAARPYFGMVSRWVYEGRLDDTYGEFFISESARARDERSGGPAADFWQKHFVLEERSVPQFLSASRDKILHAGKYLHVFSSVASPGAELPEPEGRSRLQYSRRRRDLTEAIDGAYRRASAALLGLFMGSPVDGGLDLPGRLRSMRSFFFLGRADWFSHFMDTAGAELEQNANDKPLARLEGLLDLAVRASSAAADPYREDISCGMHSFPIEDACRRMARGHVLQDYDDDAASVKSSSLQGSEAGAAPAASRPTGAGGAAIPAGVPAATAAAAAAGGAAALGVAGDTTGVRCFTLKYRTSWPLSIVFSRALLLKYQVIFRHLLYCRYVERKLVEVWVDHQYTKELGLDTSFHPSYSLRQRMLHFCRDYIYYVTVEVLEPQSHSFLSSLGQKETIDEVLHSHEKFLDTCLREVLLTEREGLYSHLSKVLRTCLSFAYNLRKFAHDIQETQVADERSLNELGSQALSAGERRFERRRHDTQRYLSILSQKQYSRMISKFKVVFESQLQGFLRQIRQESTAQYEHFLSNMLTRLDYNEYYSSVLAGTAPTGHPRELISDFDAASVRSER